MGSRIERMGEAKGSKFRDLLNPGRIGNLELRNRIVMAPMRVGLVTNEGFIDERLKSYYVARAKGGVGLIITGTTIVDPDYARPGQHVAIYNEKVIPGLHDMIEAVHVHGAKIFIMLWHPGRQWSGSPQPIAPSSIACRSFMYGDRQVPRELTSGEVEGLVEKFVKGAKIAQIAGADGVALHGTHGYIIHQFLSPYTNARMDKYGGSLEKRTRFAVEIIERIREECGADFPIDIRLGQDFVVPGNTVKEIKVIAKILESKGLACIGASGGMHESTREKLYDGVSAPMGVPPGWELEDAEAIKSAVRIPVFAVGGLGIDLELAERVLEEGKADFIQIGRPLIADSDLPIKVTTGRLDEINWCIRCGECHPHDRDNLRKPVLRCTVNAFAGREAEFEWRVVPASKAKKVLIVGGGPGGMEAARIAALRGHEVTLYEKRDELGGELLLAVIPPGKREIERKIKYLSYEIRRLGVNVNLGIEVTPELVGKAKPDVVILATGSTPSIPQLTGIKRDNVSFVKDVLTGKAKIGEKVVIIGGGGIGAEVAYYLAEKGKRVTIVRRTTPEELEKDTGRGSPTRLQKEYLPDLWGVATDLPRRYRMILLKRLGELGVKAIFGAQTKEITEKGVILRGIDGERKIEADTVVVVGSYKPNRELYLKLFGRVPELYTIGDCVEPRRILDAIGEGAYVALRI